MEWLFCSDMLPCYWFDTGAVQKHKAKSLACTASNRNRYYTSHLCSQCLILGQL